MIGADNFFLAFADAPLEICERRDVKGFYAKARAANLPNFTGVDDRYDPPTSPDIHLDTVRLSIRGTVNLILSHLEEAGFLDRETAPRQFEPTAELCALAH